MKCSHCNESADYKCACDKPYMCENHLGSHLKTIKNLKTIKKHQFESLNEELGYLRLIRFRLKIVKRIKKIKEGKNKLALKSKSLIDSIERAFKQASNKLDALIESYSELLNRQFFFSSELPIIVKIETSETEVRAISIDEITNEVQNAYSIELISYEKKLQNGHNEFLNQSNGGFQCGVITKDCQTLATGGYDSVIRVWDLIQKRQKFVLLGHNSDVKCLTLTGDQQFLISGSIDASVRVWNLLKKSQLVVLKGHKGGVEGVCYIEAQSLIVSGDKKREIIVWDLKRHSIKNRLSLSGEIWSLVLMKSRSCIVASEGKNLALVELETLKKLKVIEGHSKTVRCLALADDEKKVASGSWDKNIIVWDLNDQIKISQLVGHNGTVCSLAFTQESKFIVSGSDDESVRVWNISNCFQVFIFQVHTLFVNSILRANLDFLSLSADSGIGRLELNNGTFKVNRLLKPFECLFVEFSNESKLIGYGRGNEAAVWDLETETNINVLTGHHSNVNSVEISSDGRFALSCSRSDKLNLIYWDLERKIKIAELKGHTNSVFCASFSKDGFSAASGSYDKTVRVWDLKNLEQTFEFHGHSGNVYSIKFINDKNLLVSAGGDMKIIVWNLYNYTQYAIFNGHKNLIWKVLVTNNEKFIISGDLSDGIRIWNIEKKQQEFLFSFELQALSWLEQNEIELESVRRFLKA